MEHRKSNTKMEGCWVLHLSAHERDGLGASLVTDPSGPTLRLLVRDVPKTVPAGANLVAEWQRGTPLLLMVGSNEVASILRVTGDPVDASVRQGGARAVSWPVELEHRFDPPFHTIAHVGENAILSAMHNETARRIAAEVAEARTPNGFTIDWSPLIGNY